MSVKRYKNFLDYWDSRLDENEKVLNNYPQLANFTFRECNKLWDALLADYAALEAHHNALVEAVAWERECQSFTYRNPLSIDAMKETLRTRYAARAEVDRLIAKEG